MKFAVDRREATLGSTDASITGVFERSEKDEPIPRLLAKEDQATGGLLAAAWNRREVKGRRREVTVIYRPDGKGRVVLIGLGPRTSFDPEVARRGAAEAIKAL